MAPRRWQPKRSTTSRGYGTDHQALRRRWAPLVEAGKVNCHRPTCGKPIQPGTPWDLGHDDHDRTRYTGPEHARCNRQAGIRKLNRLKRARRQVTSLRW